MFILIRKQRTNNTKSHLKTPIGDDIHIVALDNIQINR